MLPTEEGEAGTFVIEVPPLFTVWCQATVGPQAHHSRFLVVLTIEGFRGSFLHLVVGGGVVKVPAFPTPLFRTGSPHYLNHGRGPMVIAPQSLALKLAVPLDAKHGILLAANLDARLAPHIHHLDPLRPVLSAVGRPLFTRGVEIRCTGASHLPAAAVDRSRGGTLHHPHHGMLLARNLPDSGDIKAKGGFLRALRVETGAG
mmetsp:Transcript_35509/g.45601  ORF Transcript_35509/g.45601 Transcript_35509/m.45601 type:complete len:202 (-) Transcript_35509:363-968(-)